MPICSACGEEGVAPRGRKNSPYLLVFTEPYYEVKGWGGNKLTGLEVLRKEMFKVGLDLGDFRMAWLWLHKPGKNDACYDAGKSVVLDEAKDKQLVVLVGADACNEFTTYKADTVYGLEVDTVSLSAPHVFVIPKPEGVFVRGAGIGELRLSIQKLARLLNEE
jgi:hypothetical protein